MKHGIKHKTSPARLAQLLQPSLAFLDWTVRCHWLQPKTMAAATVVQVLQDLFYVLLHVLFYLWSLLYRKIHQLIGPITMNVKCELTANDLQSNAVGGGARHWRGGTLIPCLVVRPHRRDVQGRPVPFRPDLVMISARIDLSPVLLPAQNRNRNPGEFRLECNGLTLGHWLVVHSRDKPRRRRRLTSCIER